MVKIVSKRFLMILKEFLIDSGCPGVCEMENGLKIHDSSLRIDQTYQLIANLTN